MNRQVSTVVRAGKAAVLALGIVCVCIPVVRAEDNTTNIIDGIVIDWGDVDLYVGNTGSNNYLAIINGGEVTNVSNGYIGNQTLADNNAALVSGTGSVWNIKNNLYISYWVTTTYSQ